MLHPHPAQPHILLTCCVVLVVVDELWNSAKVMLLCQVELSLWGCADVVMSAASSYFPVERGRSADVNRLSSVIKLACTGNVSSLLTTDGLSLRGRKKNF